MSLSSGAIDSDAADVNDIDIDALCEGREALRDDAVVSLAAAPTSIDETSANKIAAPIAGSATAEINDTGHASREGLPEPPAKWRSWMRERLMPWLRSLRAALVVWIAAGTAYTVATVYSFRFRPGSAPHIHTFIGAWNRFDTEFYVRIATDGYLWSPFAPAFYPLYPFLIKITSPIVPGNPLVAAMALSVFFALTALTLLHRMVTDEFGEQIASRTIFYLCAFPAGFFLFAAYNESLYLTLVLVALYYARRGNYWIASAAAALAGSTRLFGLLLFAPLAYEYMRTRGWNWRKIRWDALSFLYIPSGVAAFSIWLHFKAHDWLAFSHAQNGWKRSYGWPGEPIWESLRLLNDKPFFTEWRLLVILELISVLTAVVALALGFRGRFKFRPDQYYLLVYAAVPILMFSCTMAGWPDYLMSAPRIALEWFPVFIVLGTIGVKRSFERIYLFVGLTLQTMLLAQMLLGFQFVA